MSAASFSPSVQRNIDPVRIVQSVNRMPPRPVLDILLPTQNAFDNSKKQALILLFFLLFLFFTLIEHKKPKTK